MMSDTARSQIYAKIRAASRGLSPEQINTELYRLGTAPAAELPADSLAISFLANVVRNGGSIECASNRSEAVKAVAKYLYQRFHSHKLVAGNDPRLAAMPWRDGGVLPRFGAAVSGEPASLSYARVAVAETGSIVTWTGKANPSSNNLLVEDHIVLVDEADLVATLDHAWERINLELGQSGKPRGINFISGPSSSADIEGTLVTGAHGPRNWHVIVIGNLPADTLEIARQLS